jgi:hypothetical protein
MRPPFEPAIRAATRFGPRNESAGRFWPVAHAWGRGGGSECLGAQVPRRAPARKIGLLCLRRNALKVAYVARH